MEEYIEALMEVQPENLKPEAKQLFDVIMRVIDERDEYKKAINLILGHIKELGLEVPINDVVPMENSEDKIRRISITNGKKTRWIAFKVGDSNG